MAFSKKCFLFFSWSVQQNSSAELNFSIFLYFLVFPFVYLQGAVATITMS